MTDPARLNGKTVFEIVHLMGGAPFDDSRHTDPQPAGHPRSGPLTYGPHEDFSGRISYLDPDGYDTVEIEVKHGVATQVTHSTYDH